MSSLSESNQKVHLVYISDQALLGPSDEEIDQLISLAQSYSSDWQKVQTIALIQKTPVQAYTKDFYRRVSQSLLRSQLETRILKLRLLMRLIKTSPCLWIYVSHKQTLGPYAELSLACHYHFCTSTVLNFGFPEILANMFPFCGIFESQYRNSNRLLDEWKQRPIRKIQKGGAKIRVIFVAAENPEELLDVLQTKLERSIVISSKTDSICTWYQDCLSGKERLRLQGVSTKNHWQDSLQIIKKQEDRVVQAKWFIQGSSAFLFSKMFMTSLRRLPFYGSLIEKQQKIYIDISQALIDSFPFLELLGAGFSLVISSMDRSKLQRGLELLYLAIERKGNKGASSLWEKQVFWAVGSLPVHCNFIKYHVDRSIEFKVFGKYWKGWLLKTERGSPHLISVPDHYSYDKDFMFSAGFRVINTPAHTNLPTFIRSWALEEIYSLASQLPSFDSLLQELKNNQWGFIASQSDWDFFLKYRHFDELQSLTVGEKTLENDLWELESWKMFLKKESTDRVHHIKVLRPSEHFYLFSVMVCCVIAHAYPKMDKVELSMLVSGALGLPKNFNLQLLETPQITTRRTDHYITRFWPSYSSVHKHLLPARET